MTTNNWRVISLPARGNFYSLPLIALVIGFVMPLPLFAQSTATASGSVSGPATTAPAQPANSSPASSSTPPPVSGLQAESKALVYEAISNAMQRLTRRMDDKLAYTYPASTTKLVFNAPFSPTDVSNLFELERQLSVVEADAVAVNSDQKFSDFLDKVKKLEPAVDEQIQPTEVNPTGPATMTTFSFLGELAPDATSVGAITDAISGVLTLVSSLKTQDTISMASANPTQDTLNRLFAVELFNQNRNVYDYSQCLPRFYTSIPLINQYKTAAGSIMVIENMDNEADATLDALTAKISTLLDQEKGNKETQKRLQKEQNGVNSLMGERVYFDNRIKPLVALINALIGAQTAQGNDKKPTVKNNASGGDQSNSQTVTVQAPSGQSSDAPGNGSAAAGNSAINPLAKYALISSYLQDINPTAQGTTDQDSKAIKSSEASSGAMLLISCNAAMADATQTTVSRFLLENPVTLSGIAYIEVQAIDVATGHYAYVGKSEVIAEDVYREGKIRDHVEDFGGHPLRETENSSSKLHKD